jgi:uncharacterized protein (DUF433 family)/ribosomal protein L32
MTNEETSNAPAAIVQDELLGGEPRLEGHRIGVFHIWTKYRQGKTSEEIADEVYPHLRHEQVETAIEYAKTHPDRMAAIERERKRAVRERRRRARERKQLALGKACPHCGGQLRAGEDLPLALVWCPSCGEVHVVKRLLSDTP